MPPDPNSVVGSVPYSIAKPGSATSQAGNALSGLFGLSTLPSQGQSMAAQISAGGQLGLNEAEYQAQSGYIGQNLGNQLAQSGISGQQLGLQQQGVQSELGFAGQQYGLGQQSRAIQGQGLAAQLSNSQYQQNRANQNALGSAAASGSTNTVGTQRSLQDIAQQYGYEQGGIGRSQRQLGISGQQAAVSYQQQTDSLRRSAQSLSLSAKSLGLSEQQMHNQATQALQQLGLSTAISAQDIFQGVADAQQGLYTPLQPIIDQVFGIIQGGTPSGPLGG